jgi:hypothetical protein
MEMENSSVRNAQKIVRHALLTFLGAFSVKNWLKNNFYAHYANQIFSLKTINVYQFANLGKYMQMGLARSAL